jgi:hypothetical protein
MSASKLLRTVIVRALVVRLFQVDIAQAIDAVGLAHHGADLAEEGYGLLLAGTGVLVVRALPVDLAQAMDAVGLGPACLPAWRRRGRASP